MRIVRCVLCVLLFVCVLFVWYCLLCFGGKGIVDEMEMEVEWKTTSGMEWNGEEGRDGMEMEGRMEGRQVRIKIGLTYRMNL